MNASSCCAETPTTPSITASLIAQNVINLRKARSMSSAVLAVRTGWSGSRIAAIEAGSVDTLHLDDIDTLAKALVVEPAALFA